MWLSELVTRKENAMSKVICGTCEKTFEDSEMIVDLSGIPFGFVGTITLPVFCSTECREAYRNDDGDDGDDGPIECSNCGELLSMLDAYYCDTCRSQFCNVECAREDGCTH
jgi:hypothetical protein